MEHLKNLMGALLKAKSAMGALTKDSKNPHFKSSYASLAAVVDVLRQPLADNGIVYIESPVPELEPGRISIDLTICHATSGESVTYRSPVMVTQQMTPQGIGSTLTYARRYHLMTVFGLAPEDDDGNEGAKAQTLRQQPQRQAPPVTDVTPTNGNGHTPTTEIKQGEFERYASIGQDPPMVSNVQLKKLNALGTQLYGAEWTDEKRHALVAWKTKNRTESSKQLTADEADSLISGLQRKINEAAAEVQSAPADNPFTETPEPVTA